MNLSKIQHRHKLYMRKYRKTDRYKAYMKRYFKDYYKRDYAAKAKNERQNKYRKIHGYPPTKSLNSYQWYIKSKYGLTLDDYKLMLMSQNYCCRICKLHHSKFKKQLAIDHCHVTGQIRGLLCHHCNSALGNFKDKVESLQEAIKYLGEFK